MPVGQNWSCRGCTDCCRNWLLVALSSGEKLRLEKQNWTAADGVKPSKLFVSQLGGWRLGHQADGACVFLDASGGCRIHAKFGEAEKPLACRLYPLVIHPAGKKLLVGLRFSCLSAVANQGRPLAEQGGDLVQLARLFLPEDYDKIPPQSGYFFFVNGKTVKITCFSAAYAENSRITYTCWGRGVLF